jgi:hypothetical protein
MTMLRPMTRKLAFALGIAAAAAGWADAHARADVLESTSADRREVSLTVYNDDLGLVREVRRVALPAGEAPIRFMDVASEIRPETVAVGVASGSPVDVLEQNYEYDLLSPAKVLEKYVGREVTVYVKNDETGEEKPVTAKLLSTNQGEIFQIGDQISLGLPGRVVVPQLPENLIARPTLVWLLDADGSGTRDLDVSYLTRSIGWRADYVAALAADEKTVDLTGWVTIDNHSGAAYENAKLKLVAGNVHTVTPPPTTKVMRGMAMAQAGEAFAQREFFEYHLYELGRRTTLKDNQTKQIELLSAQSVPVTKRYVAESQFDAYGQPRGGEQPPRKVAVKLELTNDAKSHLGKPLPKGIVRVYKRDTDGALTFAGEDRVDHTPKGETIRLALGEAFDVVWEHDVTAFHELSKREVEADVKVTVRNRKNEPVRVTVIEKFRGERQLLSSSIEPTEPDAFTLEFDVPVAADDEAAVTYRVRARR